MRWRRDGLATRELDELETRLLRQIRLFVLDATRDGAQALRARAKRYVQVLTGRDS